jgi:hypothetical protein
MNLKLLADIAILCTTALGAWFVLRSEVSLHEERIKEIRQTIAPYGEIPQRLRYMEEVLKEHNEDYKENRARIDAHDRIMASQTEMISGVMTTLKEVKEDLRESRTNK